MARRGRGLCWVVSAGEDDAGRRMPPARRGASVWRGAGGPVTLPESEAKLVRDAERRLGVAFDDPARLIEALTHRSYLNEQAGVPTLSQLAAEGWIDLGGRGCRHRVKQGADRRAPAAGKMVRVLTPYRFSELGSSNHQLLNEAAERLGNAGYHLEIERHPGMFARFDPKMARRLAALPGTAGWILLYGTPEIQGWLADLGLPLVTGMISQSMPSGEHFGAIGSLSSRQSSGASPVLVIARVMVTASALAWTPLNDAGPNDWQGASRRSATGAATVACAVTVTPRVAVW